MKPFLLALLLVAAACGGASSSSSGTSGGTSTSGSTTADETTTPPPDDQVGGALCGTRGAPECPEGQFCDFPDGSDCGATDRGGRCVAKPEMCTREFRPVCGCDGQTHPTACVAHSNGVSVAHEGECGE